MPLIDIVPGPEPAVERDPLTGWPPSTYTGAFAAIGERLFFVVRHDRFYDLWTSDGRPTGTAPLARFAGIEPPRPLGAAGGVLLFVGYDERHGYELWRSDGSAAGTRLLVDIQPGREPQQEGGPDRSVAAMGGRLYFGADDGRHGYELWRSDGSAAGTHLVRDLAPGRASSYAQRLLAAADRVYFLAAEHRTRFGLWRSDGTATGTRPVPVGSTLLADALTLGGSLLFADPVPNRGVDLWITNGTSAARLLRSWPNPPSGVSQVTLLARIGQLAYFEVIAGSLQGVDIALWRTDGTARGTLRLAQLEQGVYMVPFDGNAYFASSTGYAAELWTSDGTPAGTRLFADLHPGDRSSSPAQLTDVAGTLFFAADDGEHGPEVWRSDGSGAGTALLADLAPPPPFGESPRLLARLGDRLLFATTETDPPYQTVDGSLWITDAAGHGADLLRRDIGQAQAPRLLGGNALFFTVRAEDEDYEWLLRLWRSDGTAAGTELVADIGEFPRSGPQGWSLPPPVLRHVVIAGGRLYFLVQGTLWRSDGTAAGTGVVEGLCAGACDAFHALAAVGDVLYLAAVEYGLDGGSETLWRSDGTPQGTHLIQPFFGGPFSPSLDRLTPAGSRLLFVADDRVHGAEPWVSDGTAAGTRMVRD
ncbi:MAG: ELWxxDGT repeat protein, partial [Thermoanaerobaculia bacterium]